MSHRLMTHRLYYTMYYIIHTIHRHRYRFRVNMIMSSFYSHRVSWILGNNSKQSVDFVFHTPDTTPPFVHLPLPPFFTLSHDCAPSASCVSISHHAAACCQLPSRGITCLSSPLALIQQNNLPK